MMLENLLGETDKRFEDHSFYPWSPESIRTHLPFSHSIETPCISS